MPADVSVLVLNYNGREHLLRCLEACTRLRAAGSPPTVVAVDNGSRDGSVEAVRRAFPQVGVLANDANLGFARAYNEAVGAATTEWVALLNNDAVPEPDWLDAALEAAHRHAAVCVGSRMLKDGGARVDFAGASMNFYGHGFHPHFDEPAAAARGEEGPALFVCAGAMLVRRDVFLEAGGFDDDYFAYFEDVDLGWRLNVLGHDVVYAPDSVVRHAHGATSSALGGHQRLAWVERNGLRSVVKNYDERRLGRILPVALALTAERALLDSGIDPDPYFFERTAASGAPVQPERRRDRQPGAAATGAGGLGHRARRLVRARGLAGAAGYAAFRLLGRRYGGAAAAQAMNPTGFSRVAALDAVVRDSAGLARRRAAVQAARRRSDDDVVRLFREPFRPSFPQPQLRDLQDELVQAFGLEELL